MMDEKKNWQILDKIRQQSPNFVGKKQNPRGILLKGVFTKNGIYGKTTFAQSGTL